jgi:hypothetical protein
MLRLLQCLPLRSLRQKSPPPQLATVGLCLHKINVPSAFSMAVVGLSFIPWLPLAYHLLSNQALETC